MIPGNSIGTLNVSGNFTNTSSGTFQLEIGSLSSFDKLIVGGSADLAGTLELSTLGGWQLAGGQYYTFLFTNNGISGTFTSITNVPAGLTALLIIGYEFPDALTLLFLLENLGTVSQAITASGLPALNPNQIALAGALGECYKPTSTGDQLTVYLSLALLELDQFAEAFNRILPTFYESLANTTIEQSNALGQMLEQRFSAVRLGSRGFSMSGFQAPIIEESAGQSYIGADAKEGKDILRSDAENKWGVWVQGDGMFARNFSVNNAPSYRYAGGGIFGGADYRWIEGVVTGLYSGYQGTYSKYDGGGRNIMNAVNFGGYATYDAPGNGFYMDGIVGGGATSYNVRRPIQFGSINRTARSRPSGGNLLTLLAAGYDWEIRNFTLGPILTGQYTYVGIGSFAENGADSLNLRLGQQNANSIRTSVGGRVAYTWKLTDSISIIPEGRMFWQHEFLQYPRAIATGFDGGVCPGFDYWTASPARDAVFAGAGLIFQIGEHWNANCYYNADFGRQDFVSHMVSGGISVAF